MHASLLRRGFVAVLLALSPLFLRAADKPALPAKVEELIDVLFRAPRFERGRLSPDGAHFAFIHEMKDHKVLDSYEFKTGKFYRLEGNNEADSMKKIFGNLRQGIGNFNWLGADQIYVTDSLNNIGASGHWVATAQLKRVQKLEESDRFVNLLDPLPQNADTALFIVQHQDIYGTIWRMNKKTLNLYETIGSNPGKAVNWEIDLAGEVRLAMVADPGGGWSFMHRPAGGRDWNDTSIPSRSYPVTFDSTGQTVLMSCPGPAGRYQLQSFSPKEDKFSGEPIADPVYDVSPLAIEDPKTGTPVGLYFYRDKPAFMWLNGQYAQVHATLQQAFPNTTIFPRGILESGEVLFSVSSDTAPPVLYRFDVAKHEVHSIIAAYPDMGNRKWAPMQPIAFTTRDGASVYGYLTLPPGRKPNEKIPLVALSHGGPAERDLWGFDPEVQFLATLGYGVLQVNYRGSTGYGRQHELENIIEVNNKSVDDVVDGIRWTIDQGYTDAKRIIAYGGSYGGYISLAIATRYPDLLAATVGFAGVYDWVTQLKESKKYSGGLFRWRKDYYPDFNTNAERYRAFSPVFAADKVRCPVMLMHGGTDYTVDIKQTSLMAGALRDAGKSVEVIKDAEGIHGLPNEEARRTFYRSVAAFLLKNVPPDPAP